MSLVTVFLSLVPRWMLCSSRLRPSVFPAGGAAGENVGGGGALGGGGGAGGSGITPTLQDIIILYKQT